jgi:acetyl-CoA carboxylase / biotin carboxylase 1
VAAGQLSFSRCKRACTIAGAQLSLLHTRSYLNIHSSCPARTQLVVIANDITFEAGSFGTREDVVFLLASRYARAKGIPRLYIAANSGARIGLAEGVKQRFKVAWQDDAEPALGYRYLYLSDEDHEILSKR